MVNHRNFHTFVYAHNDSDETNMNHGVPNSQKGMNEIHRELHLAHGLTEFCTNEKAFTVFLGGG